MSTEDAIIMAAMPCVICDRPFWFDPGKVPCVLVDPWTGRPPDVDAAGHRLDHPDQAAVDRSVARPYCPHCAAALNREAARRNLPQVFDETDTSLR